MIEPPSQNFINFPNLKGFRKELKIRGAKKDFQNQKKKMILSILVLLLKSFCKNPLFFHLLPLTKFTNSTCRGGIFVISAKDLGYSLEEPNFIFGQELVSTMRPSPSMGHSFTYRLCCLKKKKSLNWDVQTMGLTLLQ